MPAHTCTQCISGALAVGHASTHCTDRVCMRSLQLATAAPLATSVALHAIVSNAFFAWCAAGFAAAVSTPHSCVPAHSVSVAPLLVYASTHDTTSLHAQLPAACNRHCDCISCSKERFCSHTVHHWTQSLPRMQSSRMQSHVTACRSRSRTR